jgi:hypothetical protein
MATMDEVLRRGIARLKETRYATARKSGVHYNTLARWLDEKDTDIRLSTAQDLANYLELELKPKSKGGAR